MPDQDTFLTGLRDLYRRYEETVEELERNRKIGEGVFGMKGGPADNPCHDRFAEELRGCFAEFAAGQPDSAQVRGVLDFVYTEPVTYRGPRCAYWMLLAVQGLTKELIPLLSPADADALAERFEADYRPCDRLPAQNELLTALRKAGTGKPAAARFSLLKRR